MRRHKAAVASRRVSPQGTSDAFAHGPSYRLVRTHRFFQRLAVADDGYINFVSCFLFMAFILGLALVGNVGQATNDRIELQNAADAGAYSAALQMARGMNAVTATNHMMGEATAVIVALDAFVGRERLRDARLRGQEVGGEEVENANEAIKSRAEKAPYPTPVAPEIQLTYGYPLQNADKEYVKGIVELFVRGEFGKQKSHAALYDAQLALKTNVAFALLLKEFCSIMNEAGQYCIKAGTAPPLIFLKVIGWGCEALGVAGHMYIDYELFNMAREWIVLKAVETAVQIEAVPRTIELCEQVVIPALSYHGDSVVGLASKADGESSGASGPMNRAVAQTLTTLQSELAVDELAIYPAADELTLPVEPEPADADDDDAAAGATPPNDAAGLWGAGFGNVSDDAAEGPMQQMRNQLQPLVRIIAEIDKAAGPLLDFIEEIGKAADMFNFVQDLAGEWIGVDLDLAKGSLSDAVKALGRARDLIDGLNAAAPLPIGYSGNPSKKVLDEDAFDWQRERTSQWTRATFPYVVSYRTPIRDFFRGSAGVSNASTYYANWTNRYTLVESYHIRHGDEDDKPTTDDDGDGKSNSAIDAWREFLARLTEYRKQFFSLDEVDELDSAVPDEWTIDSISAEVEDLAGDTRGAAADLIATLDVPIAKWIARALKHQELAENFSAERANSADFNADELEMSKEDYKEIARQVMVANELDELLRMLDAYIKRLEKVLALPFGAPPHMYILRESTPDTKGREPWTDVAPLQAEQMFTVVGYAHRSAPLNRMLGQVFTYSRDVGRVCQAQAMLYNANGRRVDAAAAAPADGPQPDTGWDTLNWTPPVAAPEWGSPTGERGRGRTFGGWPNFPVQVFTGADPETAASVQLNWQAKLVPLTGTRFTDATSGDSLPGGVRDALRGLESAQFESLVHH
jgi:hypothetical protein